MEGAAVWMCEAVPMLRQISRQVIASNSQAIVERKGLVNLLPPMMSTHLQVGEDIEAKFDIVVSEVMDLWCLGEGVIPTMKHAHAKLLADGGVLIPGRLAIFAQPIELGMFQQPEKDHKVNLSPMYEHFKAKYSPLRIAQIPHHMLSDDPMTVLEIDLTKIPAAPMQGQPNLEGGKPALYAKLSSATITRSGMLSGYAIWWAADLGGGNVCTSNPTFGQRSWKQIVRWLEEPRFVREGDEVQVLACHNDNQVNLDDIDIPREMVEQFQDQMQAEHIEANSAQA